MILGCLATHKTPTILEKAFNLRFELIFIPANGTVFYQPLDRRIFGILKSKLRRFAGKEALSGKKRFEIITSHLLEAWEMIKGNEKALTSAWNIPGLFKLVEKKRSRFGKNDEEDICRAKELNSYYSEKRYMRWEIQLIYMHFRLRYFKIRQKFWKV